MDVRDFRYWHRQAQAKLVRDRIEALQIARVAMHMRHEQYSSLFYRMRAAMEQLEGLEDTEKEREERARESWGEMKRLGKG